MIVLLLDSVLLMTPDRDAFDLVAVGFDLVTVRPSVKLLPLLVVDLIGVEGALTDPLLLLPYSYPLELVVLA